MNDLKYYFLAVIVGIIVGGSAYMFTTYTESQEKQLELQVKKLELQLKLKEK